MIFKNLRYLIKEGLSAVFHNGLVNTAAIGMLAACLIITGGLALVLLNFNGVIDEIGTANEISVFLNDDTDEASAEAAGEAIRALPNVNSASFVPKAEGLESLRDDFGDLLNGLENDNPIRDCYKVCIEDQSQISTTAASLEKIGCVAKVSYSNDVAERFTKIRNSVALIGTVIVVVLALVSIFIIANSVRVSAYTRRTEISIMKTVGATNGFIRVSFIVEGLIIGLFGAAIAFGVIAPVYIKLIEPGVSALQFITPIPFSAVAGGLIAVYGAAGLLLGCVGSSLAIGRYLK